MYTIENLIFVFIAYFIGSFPSGVVFSYFCQSIDIRNIGSGNTGATNAFRAGGVRLGAMVFLADMLKGLCVIILLKFVDAPIFYSLSAVLGHIFSVFLRFKGGKGFATSWGIVMGIDYMFFILIAAVWFVAFLISRYSSFAAISSVLSLGVYWIFLRSAENIETILCLVFLILMTHATNISKMINNQELKFDFDRDKTK